jgi:serine/threonine-protein kinase BUR1
MLPAEHETVSIVLKRPGAPKEMRSPPSLPFPASKNVDGKERRDVEKGRDDAQDTQRELEKLNQAKIMAQVRRREPVRRSAKDEERAYGRVFKGCGNQRDYQVTTKLGEGTFGCVPKVMCTSILPSHVEGFSKEKSTRLFTQSQELLSH